jgi:hypothetical protein
MSPGDLVTCRDSWLGTPLFNACMEPGEYCAHVMTDKEFAVFIGHLRGTDMVEVLYDGRVLTTYSCGLDLLEG